MKPSMTTRLTCIAIASGLLAGCATNPDGSMSIDHRLTGTLVGAAVGCGIAKAAKKDCAAGAAIGAAAGFMVGWYFESKKVASAQQVNKEYESRRVPVPKDDIRAAAFTSSVQSAPGAQGDSEIQVTSNTDLIGYGDKVPVVEQKYALYDEQNKLVESKTEKLAAVDGAGRYQSRSKFKTPAKGKAYRLETTLVSNGKDVKKGSYKVTRLDTGSVTLLALR